MILLAKSVLLAEQGGKGGKGGGIREGKSVSSRFAHRRKKKEGKKKKWGKRIHFTFTQNLIILDLGGRKNGKKREEEKIHQKERKEVRFTNITSHTLVKKGRGKEERKEDFRRKGGKKREEIALIPFACPLNINTLNPSNPGVLQKKKKGGREKA